MRAPRPGVSLLLGDRDASQRAHVATKRKQRLDAAVVSGADDRQDGKRDALALAQQVDLREIGPRLPMPADSSPGASVGPIGRVGQRRLQAFPA